MNKRFLTNSPEVPEGFAPEDRMIMHSDLDGEELPDQISIFCDFHPHSAGMRLLEYIEKRVLHYKEPAPEIFLSKRSARAEMIVKRITGEDSFAFSFKERPCSKKDRVLRQNTSAE